VKSLIDRCKLCLKPARYVVLMATVVVLASSEQAVLLAQPGGEGRTVTRTYYWLDSILVGALCAAALYAICRPSRRT
jgi:hypothetical protein